MTNVELLTLNDSLNAKATEFNKLQGANFAWVFLRNVKKLEKFTKETLAKQELTEAYKQYEKDRTEICGIFSTQDENGKPIIITDDSGQQKYDIDETNPMFSAKIQDLRDRNKSVLDEQSAIFKSFQDYLKEENTDVKLLTITLGMVPTEISIELMQIIAPFVDGIPEP